MDGILIIDKPEGFTSHDVVARLRRILKTKRIGHTGTLDPFATGVLVMLVGKATRLAQFLDKDEKEYEAIVRFGFETDTGDKTGSPKPQVPSPRWLKSEDIEFVLPQFRGEIEQIPPMYSAKKIDGKKLYEHARKGIEIERQPVAVRISTLEIIERLSFDDLEPATWDLGLRVGCSAGTYIRSLAEDIGRAVGVGAHLQELRRTRAGRFDISQAVKLEQFEVEPENKLLPMNDAVGHLAEFVLTGDRIEKTKSGLSTRIEPGSFQDGENVRMILENDELIAVGVYRDTVVSIQPKVVLG